MPHRAQKRDNLFDNIPFNFIQRRSHLVNDYLVGETLVNTGYVPVKYRTIFLDEAPHVMRDCGAMSLQFYLFYAQYFFQGKYHVIHQLQAALLMCWNSC
jgi:hypothetical protein